MTRAKIPLLTIGLSARALRAGDARRAATGGAAARHWILLNREPHMADILFS
ncbi:hypothetical protein [Hyphococcus luteus]|uniref:hypothetical protein n=1 Tax=Hyphococcus luteus TaxID=2058213 RepID=UPI0013FD5D6D|nr:hypothetical protein [Marinicaulis flavus]